MVVEGYQAKDKSLRANGRDISLPDGRKLFLGSSGTGAPYDDPLANIAPIGAGAMLALWLAYNKLTAEKVSAGGVGEA